MTNEQELENHENEDAQAFEESWANWDKYGLTDAPLHELQLKSVCHLWFNKGNRRGCAWAAETIQKVLTKV